MDRLKQRGSDLVYRCGKGHAEPLPSSKYADELVLTPLELIDRMAQLVPPLRSTVTAPEPLQTGDGGWLEFLLLAWRLNTWWLKVWVAKTGVPNTVGLNG